MDYVYQWKIFKVFVGGPMDLVTAIEVFLGHRCESCLKYLNEKGEHLMELPEKVDEV